MTITMPCVNNSGGDCYGTNARRALPLSRFESASAAELVLRAQAHDEEAFGALVLRFWERTRLVALKFLNNHEDAEDTAQDAFVLARRYLGKLQKPESFASWVAQIAVNISIRRRRQKHMNALEEVLDNTISEDESPPEALTRCDSAAALHDVIASLCKLDRETLDAFYFEGLTIHEMHLRFGCPEGTAKRRLSVARDRLKAQLEKRNWN